MKRTLFLEPGDNIEESAVLNPTAIKEEETTHVIYRAVKHPNYSTLGYLKIKDGILHKHNQPLMVGTEEYEKEGIEDPRITKTEGTFHLLYTAWDGKNARVALASGKSINNLIKQGIVSPNIPIEKGIELVGSERYKKAWKRQLEFQGKDSILWDKDAVLLPEKVFGKYAMLHRFDPDIQVVYFDSFKDLQEYEFWEEYLKNIKDYVVMHPKYKWESIKIGAGAPPLKTQDNNWLLLYHGVERENGDKGENEEEKYIYHAGAALLTSDLKEISRLDIPLFSPEFEWERKGDVDNVVFPQGATVDDGMLNIFYGCADTRIGLAQTNLEELVERLKKV